MKPKFTAKELRQEAAAMQRRGSNLAAAALRQEAEELEKKQIDKEAPPR